MNYYSRKIAASCFTLIFCLCLICVSAFKTGGQEFQTLELVRTYQSEKEYQAVNTQLLQAKKPIVDDGEFITFYNPETGQILKQIKKENTRDEMRLTDSERAKLYAPTNPEPVKKAFRQYYIPEKGAQYLHVREYEMTLEPGGEGDAEQQLIKSTLYNDQGGKIADLPLDSRFIYLSPDKSNFVIIGRYLYFYSTKMELLQKRENNPAISEAKYSSNGQYIAMYDIFLGKYFRIFTKGGDLLFEGNYQDYRKQNSTLYGVFVSSDGNYVLLSTSKKAVLLNINGEKQWEIDSPSTPINSVYFHKRFIYMSPMIPDASYDNLGFPSDSLKIIIVNIENGEIADEIPHIVYYTMTNNVLYFKKRGGSYYEYNIK